MSTVRNHHAVGPAALADLREPRRTLVVEAPGEIPDTWIAESGPFRHYQRTITGPGGVPLPADGADGDGDAVEVTETIEFAVAVPVWGPLIAVLYKRAFRHRRVGGPWWFPPELLDARAANALGLLCTLAVVGGYLQTLVTQTIAFAADEFDASRTAQGTTLAIVRSGTVIALAAGALADRRGRRILIIATATAGCLFSGLGALSPNLAILGLTQIVSRGSSGALMGLLAVVCAEEMPHRCRAWGFGLLTMAQALGAGVCVWVLPLADLGKGGWRLVYVVPLLGLPAIALVGRHLPESRRFERPHRTDRLVGHGRMLLLLAASGFLISMFAAPVSQFQNDYLLNERHYNAATITLYTVCTSTPAGIGIVVGGKLSELYGRRWVLAIGLFGGTIGATLTYFVAGWNLWIITIIGMIVAGLGTAPLGAYRAEVFPTSLRAKATSIIDTIALMGSALGLVLVGWLIDRWNLFGRPMAVVALGPLVVTALVLLVYPETAGRTLEELNPADAPPPGASPDDDLDRGDPIPAVG